MNRLKKFKYFTLLILLFCFVSAGSLSSCREQKKEENTEQQAEHPESEEHPTEDGDAGEEHPEGGEHPEGEEHPTDSISG